MKIAIDIDGTLNDNIPYIDKQVKKFAKKEGIKIRINPKAYEFCEKYGYTEEIDNKFWEKEIWDYASNIKQKRNANKIVKKLREDGDEIVILTARYLANRKDELGERMRDCVVSWLNKNKIYYDKIIYVGENNSKLNSFLEENCDILIDDKVEHVNEISKNNFVICMTEAYNKDIKFNNNVTKCKNWKQVYRAIKKIKKEKDENKSNSK